MTEEPTVGPVQLLVLGFEKPELHGRIREELERLRSQDMIRLVDAVMVRKDEDGDIAVVQQSDLSISEAQQLGAYACALMGLGTGDPEAVTAGANFGAVAGADGHLLGEEHVWYIADAIPEGTAAAVALIEHRWAIPLRSAILESGGELLADAWIHPADLVAVGLRAAEQVAAT
jgi:uncharacterized membrane protein